MEYHRVEKSLSLPEPRRPFGKAVGDRITHLLSRSPVEPSTSPYITYGERALASLEQWNGHGCIDDDTSPRLTRPMPLGEEQAQSFFGSRHSVRNFEPGGIPTDDQLYAIVALARNTPSVCNRQAYRVHVYRARQDIDAILRIQNGATGFADVVPALGVVTARRALFVGPDERNQRWVDGGLFAMTIVWAAHAIGLGTCMLNWALPSVSSARLRKVADIPDDEDIVVLIAIGHPKEGSRVARSQKRELDDLARIHS